MDVAAELACSRIEVDLQTVEPKALYRRISRELFEVIHKHIFVGRRVLFVVSRIPPVCPRVIPQDFQALSLTGLESSLAMSRAKGVFIML